MKKTEINHLQKVLRNLIKETDEIFFSTLDKSEKDKLVENVKDVQFEKGKWSTSPVKKSFIPIKIKYLI